MLAVQICLALALLAVSCFVPGFFFVRHLRWNPLEKLCGSIALSLIFLYLISFLIYSYAGSAQSTLFACISGLCVALALLVRRDLSRLVCSFGARQALTGFVFLLFWTALLLAMIRNYSGGPSWGDWLEHFQRSLFFLHHFPHETRFLDIYPLPARPLLMNLVAASFLAQTSDSFEIFQVVFSFLNLLVFLPCCLLMPALRAARKRQILPMVMLFALNPVVMQNVTYTWTKSLTAFFIVFALCLYLAGLRKRDGFRITSAFAVLAAGMLVHYSTGPYLAVLGLHYLVCVFSWRPHKMRELAAIAAVSLVLLLPWFGWSLKTYGARVTFASNTSITSSQQYTGSNWKKIRTNLYDTIIPVQVRKPRFLARFNQPSLAATVRDYAYTFYQPHLIFSMGVVGGPAVLALLWTSLKRRNAQAETWFWRMFIPIVVLLGVAVVGEPDYLGVAHLTLLPMEIIGLALLAASFPLRRMAALALLAGCIVDFSLGVFLQARIENLENTPARVVFSKMDASGMDAILQSGQSPLGKMAWANWFSKHEYSLAQQESRQMDSSPPENVAAHHAAFLLRQVLDKNQRAWYGWYERHGGSVQLLGDHLAGPQLLGLDVQSILLLMAAGALVALFWKRNVSGALSRVQPARFASPVGAGKP